ncbi:WD40/YVTN/BNR-like repeat-containing protein [Arenimonas sp.]|uniref:WD40/YVTN/BNR-like repeat-containing protein n=1 Tax=Arenimonas sp. TaxID=1872635 RepID=UPI0035AEEA71
MSSKPFNRTRLAGALLLAMLLPLAAQSQDAEAPAADEMPEEVMPGSAEPVEATASDGAQGSAASVDPAALDAEMMPRASQSLLLDVVQTAAGYFVVGERGHVLISEDGREWKQAPVPTRSTLTSITSADGVLWAGGHDGVIVHSTDGGQTWTRRRMQVWTPDYADPLDGVPVMDILMVDGMNGFAVGAYAMFLETADGGVTWTPRGIINYDEPEPAPAEPVAQEPVADEPAAEAPAADDWTFDASDLELEAEADPHLYAMARTDEGHLVIAGERGAFFRSTDGGQSWERDRLPYEGSMFGVLSFGGGHLLVHGLRGNVLESRDLGRTWTNVDTGVNTSLMGGHALANGGAILVGANGVVLTRPDADSPFTETRFEMANGETPNLTGVLPAGDAGFIVVGDKGAGLFRPQ